MSNQQPSDTPLTDAEAEQKLFETAHEQTSRLIEHARAVERKLNAAQKEIERLKKCLYENMTLDPDSSAEDLDE